MKYACVSKLAILSACELLIAFYYGTASAEIDADGLQAKNRFVEVSRSKIEKLKKGSCKSKLTYVHINKKGSLETMADQNLYKAESRLKLVESSDLVSWQTYKSGVSSAIKELEASCKS